MPADSPTTVSVVIPVFRGAASLPELVDRLTKQLTNQTSCYEIILVSDASPDHSWQVIQELAANHPQVRGIELMRNYGQHNAILCGIRVARHELIVTMDDDLQHPPEEIPKLLKRLKQGDFDVVYGVFDQGRHGLLRNCASQLTKLVLKGAMGVDVARSISPYRVFRTSIREAFTSFQSQYICIDVLLTWGSSRFGTVEVQHDPRRYGQSSYTLTKLLIHALNMVTGYSTLPLQAASLMGFCFTLLGMCVLLYTLAKYFVYGSVVPGFPFLASIIAIFSGAQLFALGIIGEYIARIHLKTMDKPSYAIRAETESSPEAEISGNTAILDSPLAAAKS